MSVYHDFPLTYEQELKVWTGHKLPPVLYPGDTVPPLKNGEATYSILMQSQFPLEMTPLYINVVDCKILGCMGAPLEDSFLIVNSALFAQPGHSD